MFRTEDFEYPDVKSTTLQFAHVSTYVQYYKWLEDVLVSKVFSDSDQRPLLVLEDAVNVVVGGVKVRQVRAPTDDCSDELAVYLATQREIGEGSAYKDWYHTRIQEWFNPTCASTRSAIRLPEESLYGPVEAMVSELARTNDTTAAWAAVPSPPSDRAWNAFRFGTCGTLHGNGRVNTEWNRYGCAGHALILPVNLTVDSALADVEYLKENNWIDSQTAMVVAELVFFNYNMKSFSLWRFVAETHTGGTITTDADAILFRPFIADDFSVAYYFFLAVYLASILVLLAMYIGDLLSAYRSFRRGGATTYYSVKRLFTSDLWWFFNGINLALFLAAWCGRFWFMAQGTADIELFNANAYPETLEQLAEASRVLDVLDACTVLLCALKLLFFFRMSPDLNLLMRTMVLAATRILSLLFIFCCAFVCMGLTAFLLYGNYLKDFSTLEYSFASLFRNLLGDDIPYDDMVALKPIYTGVYYTIFLVICNFILFNLVIGVLGVAFNEAQAEKYDLRSFYAIFRNDTDAIKKFNASAGVLKKIFCQVVTEIRLLIHQANYYLTFPFVDRYSRRRRKMKFNRNPRYLWETVLNILNAPNPRREWRIFVAEFGLSLVPMIQRTAEGGFVVPEERGADERGSSFLRRQSTAVPAVMSARPRPSEAGLGSNSSKYGRSFKNLRQTVDRESSEKQQRRTQTLYVIASIDVEQSYKENPNEGEEGSKQSRVRRLEELFDDDISGLGVNLDTIDTLNFINIAADILGFPRKFLLEWLLQSIHRYKADASRYTAVGMQQEEAIFRLQSYATLALEQVTRLGGMSETTH